MASAVDPSRSSLVSFPSYKEMGNTVSRSNFFPKCIYCPKPPDSVLEHNLHKRCIAYTELSICSYCASKPQVCTECQEEIPAREISIIPSPSVSFLDNEKMGGPTSQISTIPDPSVVPLDTEETGEVISQTVEVLDDDFSELEECRRAQARLICQVSIYMLGFFCTGFLAGAYGFNRC